MVQRVESSTLVEAGLETMRRASKSLSRVPSAGRSMIYALPDGQTVRIRTCNDHVLIVVGDRPTEDAKLNIEGTNWLLVVMPEIERTPGKTVAYLLPTAEVAAEARLTHKEWLRSNPNTKGDNRTWNLWFRDDGPPKASGYAAKWAKYRLDNAIDTRNAPAGEPPTTTGLTAEVENARRRIAHAAGVPVEAVKIVINFEG